MLVYHTNLDKGVQRPANFLEEIVRQNSNVFISYTNGTQSGGAPLQREGERFFEWYTACEQTSSSSLWAILCIVPRTLS